MRQDPLFSAMIQPIPQLNLTRTRLNPQTLFLMACVCHFLSASWFFLCCSSSSSSPSHTRAREPCDDATSWINPAIKVADRQPLLCTRLSLGFQSVTLLLLTHVIHPEPFVAHKKTGTPPPLDLSWFISLKNILWETHSDRQIHRRSRAAREYNTTARWIKVNYWCRRCFLLCFVKFLFKSVSASYCFTLSEVLF